MRRDREPVTLEKIRAAHRERRREIRARLDEFEEVRRTATDERLWEELVFCIFTAGASARMGLGSVEAVRHLLGRGTHEELAAALQSRHRYPNSRSGYIVVTRARYLSTEERLRRFADDLGVDFDELDLVLWSLKTGEILK